MVFPFRARVGSLAHHVHRLASCRNTTVIEHFPRNYRFVNRCSKFRPTPTRLRIMEESGKTSPSLACQVTFSSSAVKTEPQQRETQQVLPGAGQATSSMETDSQRGDTQQVPTGAGQATCTMETDPQTEDTQQVLSEACRATSTMETDSQRGDAQQIPAGTDQNKNTKAIITDKDSSAKAQPGIKRKQKNKKGSTSKGTDDDAADEKVELRHIRYREYLQEHGKPLPVPGYIDLQVVGCGINGTPRGVLINMDHFKYLVNCGEGTQRIIMEQRMRMTRIEHVFITHNNWENIGGLLGLCLSFESQNVPQLHLHGPPHVEKLISFSRSFAQVQKVEIEKHDVEGSFHDDSAMRVQYVPFYKSEHNGKERSPSPNRRGGKFKDQPHVNNMSVAYIFLPHPKPRSISFEKIVDLNVPRTKVIGLLKEGQTVTLEDGRVIKPVDVLEDAVSNKPFIVVECPSEDYLESLCTLDVWKQYYHSADDDPDDSPKDSKDVDIIIHLSSSSIISNPQYQEWLNRFGTTTKHLYLNEAGPELSLEGIYSIQAKLNMLHETIFPLLPAQINLQTSVTKSEAADSIHRQGETNLKYVYRSRNPSVYSRKHCIQLDNALYIKEAMAEEDLETILPITKEKILKAESDMLATSGREFPKIVFLGTGSSVPSKVRNVSGILVFLREDSCLLMDCGENTIGQLWRHYAEDTPDILHKIKTIYVSHLHADHHMGIIGVASARQRVLRDLGEPVSPLTVIAPIHIKDWWRQMHRECIPVIDLVRVIPIEGFTATAERTIQRQQHLAQLGLQNLETVRVRHGQFPFGVSITHEDGWKLVYSGDTMPCSYLVDLGKGCDILIHEATMEDSMEEDAAAKKHSTTSQAIDVGMQMEAGFILLTHFSQRYAKVPIFNDSFSHKVGIAFDNMEVRWRQLPLLPLFSTALKAMFAEHYAEMQVKTQKRIREAKNASNKKSKQENS